MNDLDSKIKTKFKLFEGFRTQEEDQKMLARLQELCFDDIIDFAAENLSESDRLELQKRLSEGQSEDDKAKALNDYLFKIPDANVKLEKRIDEFLDKVVDNSLSSKN